MLSLDEKKIRKGKPFGLPYQGSKKKISKKIVEIIKQNFGTDKPIYDIFGGGGAITAECILNGLEVVYSFDKARGTFQGGQSNKENEKLFMVKGS